MQPKRQVLRDITRTVRRGRAVWQSEVALQSASPHGCTDQVPFPAKLVKDEMRIGTERFPGLRHVISDQRTGAQNQAKRRRGNVAEVHSAETIERVHDDGAGRETRKHPNKKRFVPESETKCEKSKK